MKGERGGALGTTMDCCSESILSRASALGWQSRGDCSRVPQDLCTHLTMFPAGTQVPPSPRASQQEDPITSPGECTFS